MNTTPSTSRNKSTKDELTQETASAWDLVYRIGDESLIVGKLVCKLIHDIQLLKDVPACLPQNCILIPRRLTNSPSAPNQTSHLTGQVWRWNHLKSLPDLLRHALVPLAFCFAGRHQREICLNPFHYKTNVNPSILPESEEPWASMAYHEKGRRVGDVFECRTAKIQVKSTANDATNLVSFDLGKLPRPKDALIAHTRRQIGNGIELYYVGGQVFIDMYSDSDIFVQAKFFNLRMGYHKNNICRLVPHRRTTMQVMRDDDFHNCLDQEIKKGAEAVYEMASLCCIRLAFVDRWKEEVPIKEMNCWMEIKLERQLSWLTRALRQMGAQYEVHS